MTKTNSKVIDSRSYGDKQRRVNGGQKGGGTMEHPNSIHDFVTATLTELGASPQSPLVRTVLIRGSYFIGYKYRFDGGFAVWRPDESELDVYNNDGKLVKMVSVPEAHKPEAA